MYYLFTIVTSSIIIAMSYGKIDLEAIWVLCFGVVRVILSNMYYTITSKEVLQEFEDAPFTEMLRNHIILGPMLLIIDFCMLWVLFTGSMVGWYWYLLTAVCNGIVARVHKVKKGVKLKELNKA